MPQAKPSYEDLLEAKKLLNAGAIRTYAEVGQIMGISRGRVQQIERAALLKLYRKLKDCNDD